MDVGRVESVKLEEREELKRRDVAIESIDDTESVRDQENS
jgi:hypothetical protein